MSTAFPPDGPQPLGTALPRAFYDRPTLEVAVDLLGQRLVHELEDGTRRSARIVETEAYLGPTDGASHARSGPGGRAGIMWGPPGMAYVYLIYGMHNCLNAVTGPEGSPSAVLLRAAEIEAGPPGARASGPGLLCRALGIDRGCSGLDLTGSRLRIEPGPPLAQETIRMGPRIGVEFAGAWSEKPWRFWLADSPAVSRRVVGRPYDRTVLASSLRLTD